MNTQRVDAAVAIIGPYMRDNPGAELGQLVRAYVEPLTRATLDDDESEEVLARVASYVQFTNARDHAEVEDPAIVADPQAHEDWYDDWVAGGGYAPYYWPRLESFISNELREKLGDESAGRIVRSMDQATEGIVRLLEAPSRLRFSTKGLVVGFVQSGKTANFTALIAKAIDAGYRLIVVLAGTHDILRIQTQQRLDRELSGEVEVDQLTHVDVPVAEHRRFVRLTSRDNDYRQTGQTSLETLTTARNPILCVMKKNPAVMRRFRDWARRASESDRGRVPLLLIDDEADLASIDTHSNIAGASPTPTNSLIRELLALFARSAYVGYTATPFANVLIDCDSTDPTLSTDLYPRNFIVSLPRPEGYFGAEQVFRRAGQNPFVRIVPAAEVAALRTTRGRPNVLLALPEFLNRALGAFILGGAARLLRGHSDKPMTMLVHTSQSQAAHHRLRDLLEEALASLRTRAEDAYERPSVIDWLQGIWDNDFRPTSAALQSDFGNPVHDFHEIERYALEFLGDIRLLELNSSSFDDLDYTATPNIRVAAVGGNKLSRGLTLEGLMVSYYLRRSTEYDTLLQMGRWFGYRRGFEDLTRVFTSDELAGWFQDLALVEDELRDAIKRYEDEQLTPAQMAVRIRAHRTMRVTSRSKVGAGTTVQGTFSGGSVQTVWFPLDEPGKLLQNLDATGAFVTGLAQYGRSRIDSGWLARRVPTSVVLDYIRDYRFVAQRTDGGPSLDAEELINYIARQSAVGEMPSWNVLVKSLAAAESSHRAETLGDLDQVIPVTRSRLRGTTYKVGVISDPGDLTADLPPGAAQGDRTVPLLIIYPISQDSTPRSVGKLVALFDGLAERHPVIGLAFQFPASRSEPYDYIAQAI